MANNKYFFESPQAAARYKHKLLKSYIPAWAGKVGSTAPGNRVVVYDAYSGPGRYLDDQPGSPELLVDTAIAMANLRRVHTVFSEKDQSYCNQLRGMLRDKAVEPTSYEVRDGPVEAHLDQVLADTGDSPLFVFLDPFGLTIPFDRVVHVLTARRKSDLSAVLQPKTELLMNFSYEAVRRIAGALRSEKKYGAKEGQVGALNDALGGNWWHELALAESDGWVGQILGGYAARVGKATKYGYITADVADSLGVKPVYELILFTPHGDGLWEMARAMSTAREEWRNFLKAERDRQSQGQLELDVGSVRFDDDEDAWAGVIAENIQELLASQPGFTVARNLGDVLGRTLGLAREKHVRKALQDLYQRGAITTKPGGNLQKFYISRA